MGRSSDLRRTRNSVHFISESLLAIMVDLTPESANVPMVWYPKNCPICDDPEDECYYRVPRRAWCHEARKMTRAEALAWRRNMEDLIREDFRDYREYRQA